MSFIFLRNRVTGGAAFSPASLFASGEDGAWYEPSPTTCFTDTAGTTAASVGDAVARINDLSGNGNHATQGTAAARPLLQQTAGGLYYLAFDGSDDWLGLADNSLDFMETSNQPFDIFAGVARNTTNYSTIFLANGDENASASSNDGIAFANGFTTEQARMDIRSFAGSITDKGVFAGTLSAPDTFIATGRRLGATGLVRVNGVAGSTGDTSQPALTLALYTIGARRRGSTPTIDAFFDGKLFSLIVRGASSTAQEISDTESYVANLSGVTL